MNTEPKKSLGQYWLTDRESLEAICDIAKVGANDTVLEIGPGHGSLTKHLLARGAKVIAVEYDETLIENLRKNLAGDVEFEHADIRHYDFNRLPPDHKLIANIPYYLTSYLIRLLTDGKHNKPAIVALLIQKEVAQRIAASPGDMSLLSVFAQYYYEVSLGIIVPAGLFTPPPKVDSQVLCLVRRPEPLFTNISAEDFFRVVRAGFSQRRKTLVNNLKSGLYLSKDKAAAIMYNCKLDPSIRAQALTIENWHSVALKAIE
ncbi:MAG TPA: 16S rRNA (adenine(1518)-N(6)/adenine(1519)-N(6))-dimethyltransferase RsmA [Candidatus Saccharimonadales bacterium]|jgi:16S rRNA (adenine1518-N6/adenine1519-N6)-dimethyltransferase|nr:16S rRNA (adenine(1518)-N(6)/adenine(1519)-N(6))-dimethyltransferase RsmA [Candidatus Saccharimonadales bacterium]